jgi:hypothetical protein
VADIVDIAFFVALLVLAVVIVILLLRRQTGKAGIDPATLTALLTASISQSSGVIKGALAESLQEMKIGEDIGAIKSSANSMTGVALQLQSLSFRRRSWDSRSQFLALASLMLT